MDCDVKALNWKLTIRDRLRLVSIYYAQCFIGVWRLPVNILRRNGLLVNKLVSMNED